MSIPPEIGQKPPVIKINEHKVKFIGQFNEDTGELEWMVPIKPKKRITGGAWMAIYQESAIWISRIKPPYEVVRVFLNMVGKLDYNNYIRISQTDLAKELGMKQQNVSRAIKKLIELDVIAEGPRAGLSKTYIMNPNIGIKGKQKQQKIIDYAEKKRAREQEKENKSTKSDETPDE